MRIFFLCVIVAAGMVPSLAGCQTSETERAEAAKVPPSTRPYINDIQRQNVEDRSTQYGNLVH